MNGMLTLRVFIQMLTLNEAGKEHCVLHRTSSEFRIILQLRTHAESVRSCSVKMCIRLEISSEISDKGWQWSSSQRCRSSWGSEIESAGLCYYKSSQHFPLYKTGVLFVRHESIPSTLLGNHEVSAGIFYLVWAPHFRKNVSQLEEFWTLCPEKSFENDERCGKHGMCTHVKRLGLFALRKWRYEWGHGSRLFAMLVVTRGYSNVSAAMLTTLTLPGCLS